MRASKIGQVKFVRLDDVTAKSYSDGDIEDKLLELYKTKNPNIQNFLKGHPDWATTYHLSPIRKNLLQWYDFKPTDSVLEIGAGCGAITELLARKAGSVTAIELSLRRAKVNAHRNKACQNLEVIAGNLENMVEYSNKKFDYVVCVGVLEYAGRFISGADPFVTFVKLLESFLTPNGTLILAIENKLGMKYMSGSREDHTQRYLEGIEDYPHYDGIRTFGKLELTKLLRSAGFSTQQFYYPVPDYKLPHTIYSDDFLPGIHTPHIQSSHYPTPNPDQPRQQLFREQLAIRSISQNGLYGDLANSFLVFASRSDVQVAHAHRPVYAHFPLHRQAKYEICTRILSSSKFMVEKKALTESAADHLANFESNGRKLKRAVDIAQMLEINKILEYDKQKMIIKLEYVEGKSLEDELLDALIAGDDVTAKELLRTFLVLIESLPGRKLNPTDQKTYRAIFGNSYDKPLDCITPAIVDVNLDNVMHNSKTGKYCLIDYEWMFEFAVPRRFIITRAIVYFLKRHQQIMRAINSPERPGVSIGSGLFVPAIILEVADGYLKNLLAFTKSERAFQIYVKGASSVRVEAIGNFKRSRVDTELQDNVVESYEQALARLEEFVKAGNSLRRQQEEIARLTEQLQQLTGSTAWKLLQRTNRAKSYLRDSYKKRRQN